MDGFVFLIIEEHSLSSRMFYGDKDKVGKARKTSRYGKNSANRRFQLGNVAPIAPSSRRKEDKEPRLEPMCFVHFALTLKAFMYSKGEKWLLDSFLQVQ